MNHSQKLPLLEVEFPAGYSWFQQRFSPRRKGADLERMA